MVEGKGSNWQAEEVFPAIDNMRIPIQYLANSNPFGSNTTRRN
ncbi:Respiratory nitrate reductase beta chain [Bacillus cereus AH1272]|nr:Respiratory nitrate reductase beta chain [Bacillus cereus AH1272]